MYMRSYDDGEAVQSFRRGDYTIPANYAGNAFTADEPPIESMVEDQTTSNAAEPEENSPTESACQSYREKDETNTCDAKSKKEGRLISGLVSRIERGFEFDDILLIGLIILLIRENKDCREKNDEIIILLAILLLVGF